MQKKCIVCGKEFEATNSRTITCSPECAQTRKAQLIKKYYQEHKGELLNYQRQYGQKIKRIKQEVKDKQKAMMEKAKPRKITTRKNDPKWIKDYAKGDRITQVSMLACALTMENIISISYGQLSVYWNSMQYLNWESEILAIKRENNE